MASTLWTPAAVGLMHNGAAANNGQVFGYEPGTSTKKAMYPTKGDADAQTNALSNPVILDAQGRAQIWLDGVYDIEMTTSGGVAIGGTYQSVGEAEISTPEVPAGALIGWPFNIAPTGYLECNGAAVSRATYPALFAVIGTMYGNGDGSTTFNLPDYRGEFLRGWAHGAATDPDKATRTNRGDGTTGDFIGTKQAEEFKAHTHPFLLYPPGGFGGHSQTDKITPDVDNPIQAGPSATVQSAGGSETRPRNVNVMWCIKA